jgi:hypothetical protein
MVIALVFDQYNPTNANKDGAWLLFLESLVQWFVKSLK